MFDQEALNSEQGNTMASLRLKKADHSLLSVIEQQISELVAHHSSIDGGAGSQGKGIREFWRL